MALKLSYTCGKESSDKQARATADLASAVPRSVSYILRLYVYVFVEKRSATVSERKFKSGKVANPLAYSCAHTTTTTATRGTPRLQERRQPQCTTPRRLNQSSALNRTTPFKDTQPSEEFIVSCCTASYLVDGFVVRNARELEQLPLKHRFLKRTTHTTSNKHTVQRGK